MRYADPRQNRRSCRDHRCSEHKHIIAGAVVQPVVAQTAAHGVIAIAAIRNSANVIVVTAKDNSLLNTAF
jgi:hypothetical protein